MAPLPARRALAAAGGAGGPRARGRRPSPSASTRRWSSSWRPAPRGSTRRSPAWVPTRPPTRSIATRRCGAWGTRRGRAARSPRRCSTSVRWPGSATSTRARSCSSNGSTVRGGGDARRRGARAAGGPGPGAAAGEPGSVARVTTGPARWRRGDGGDPGAVPARGARLWVYRRAGRPCRRCGTLVSARRHGDLPRTTYWCPRCQGTDGAGAEDAREPPRRSTSAAAATATAGCASCACGRARSRRSTA